MQTAHTLDELELSLILRASMTPLADVIADTVKLIVEYDYTPGQRLILRADPNDCQPGFADDVELWKVTTAQPTLFDNEGITVTLEAGFDLTDLLPSSVKCRIEHDLLTIIRDERSAA
jgi:hypothetical protein